MSSTALAGQPRLCDQQLNEHLGTLDPQSPAAIELTPRLIEVVADESCSFVLRQRAAMTLGRIGSPAIDAVPVLIKLLDSSERSSAASTGVQERLSREDDDSLESSVRYWALKSLGLFGDDARAAVPRLSGELSDQSRSVSDRILVADVLGQIGTGPALAALGRELLRPGGSTPDASLLRQVIVDSVAYSGPTGIVALPFLVRATSDPDADVRRKVCEALGRLGPRAEPALDSLVERLVVDESPAVLDAAADAMSRLGPAAVPVLGAMLREGNDGMKWRAARALGRAGRLSLSEIDSLQAATSDPDSRVRIESLDALWLIQRDPMLVCEAAVQELSRDDRQTRKRASELLVSVDELPATVQQQLQVLAGSSPSGASRAASWVLRRRASPNESTSESTNGSTNESRD